MTKLIKKLSEVKILFVLGLIYTLLITIAFLTPVSDLPDFKFIILDDKLIHIILYVILAFVWLFFYHVFKEKHISFKEIFIISFLCLTHGIIIEVLQHLFVNSRQADILDVLANTIGIIIGTIVYWKAKKQNKNLKFLFTEDFLYFSNNINTLL